MVIIDDSTAIRVSDIIAPPGSANRHDAVGVRSARGMLSVAIVIGLLALFVWALRRGMLRVGPFRIAESHPGRDGRRARRPPPLAIVSIEGRRLLPGLARRAVCRALPIWRRSRLTERVVKRHAAAVVLVGAMFIALAAQPR